MPKEIDMKTKFTIVAVLMTLSLGGNLLVDSGGNEIQGEDVVIILKKGK